MLSSEKKYTKIPTLTQIHTFIMYCMYAHALISENRYVTVSTENKVCPEIGALCMVFVGGKYLTARCFYL